ncbi:MAG: hypothetical protein DRK00_05140 [Thermoprotei archaeon]|nr:MAG: hypothetical protein DRK00_05140 [Thermoprotei archaeon]
MFGGEAPSIFLQDNHGNRQVTNTGRVMSAACMNSEEFRKYVVERVEELARGTEADYIFLDEPHFSFYVQRGRGYGFKITREWSCTCEACRRLFREEYGYEMPRELNDDVLEFRQRTILSFLEEAAAAVKGADSRKRAAVCLLSTTGAGRVAKEFGKLVGIVDWEGVAAIKAVDMLGTDPYWILLEKMVPVKLLFKGLRWYSRVLDELLEVARRHGKETQAWVQAFKVPAGREGEIVEGVKIAVEKGVDSVFAWPYRAGKLSVLASERADYLWEAIGRAFRELGGRASSPSRGGRRGGLHH